jgi:hypothetical protein
MQATEIQRYTGRDVDERMDNAVGGLERSGRAVQFLTFLTEAARAPMGCSQLFSGGLLCRSRAWTWWPQRDSRAGEWAARLCRGAAPSGLRLALLSMPILSVVRDGEWPWQ